MEAAVAGQVEQAAVVDDEPVRVLADDRSLHPVVEDLARAPPIAPRAAIWQRRTVWRSRWTTKRPDQPGMAEHEGEEPDDPRGAGLVEEAHLEASEIDLRLLAGRRLEADLEWLGRLGPDLPHGALHHGVAASEAARSLSSRCRRTAVRPG